MQHIKCYGLLMWKLCIVQAFRNEVGILIHMNVYVHYDTCVTDIMRVLLFVDSAGETSESCTEMQQAVFGKAHTHITSRVIHVRLSRLQIDVLFCTSTCRCRLTAV